MSILGIDVGTTGCKTVVFREDGEILAAAYKEYDIQKPEPGWAELDSIDVWQKLRECICITAAKSKDDPICALCVSSCGEAMVPVTHDRQILGPSILNFDIRGVEYVESLRQQIDIQHFYQINGNTIGNNYSLTKLLWIRENQPHLYDTADKFLLWGSFVPFMLGCEPAVDFSLANRTLLFDLDREDWSEELLQQFGIDPDKLPKPVPSGTIIGSVAQDVAQKLGLPPHVEVIAGAHDQCAAAVGCGVIEDGLAMYGMGTFVCAVPVFNQRKDPVSMLAQGLNTEHHAAPGKFVSFIYNDGGSMVKWFRDTYAQIEKHHAQKHGYNIYETLFAEIPDPPGKVLVLPHFSITGPPYFLTDSCGFMAGLRLDTTRGDILKGILEGMTFYLRECIEALPATGIEITDFRVVGGGSKSDEWVQLSADIIGKSFIRPKITESGALGSAILAGTGSGVFGSLQEGSQAMVHLEQIYEPDQKKHKQYQVRFNLYKQAWPLLQDYLRAVMD